MTSPVPHTALPYIQFGTCMYTPNAATNALLDATLQDSCLASTLDCAIDPQSPVGFIHDTYTHHMAIRNALISVVDHIPLHQEIHTLFTLLQCSDVRLHRALLGAGTQLSLGTAVSHIDALLYNLHTESPTLPTTLQLSDDPHPSTSLDLVLTQDDEPLLDSHVHYWAACLHCHQQSHNKLHCRQYTCPECLISTPGHTISNCMGPPHSPSPNPSPTGWSSSSQGSPSLSPHFHPYHALRGCPQGIHHKKSQGTSPHPQPCMFSPVDLLHLYDPSSHPSFSPGWNLSPSPHISTLSPPPVAPMMTPPLSPLGNPDSYPNTLWNSDDLWIAILRSIGFTIDGWTFLDGLPTWEQVHTYEQRYLHKGSFDPIDQLDVARECHCLHSDSFPLDD